MAFDAVSGRSGADVWSKFRGKPPAGPMDGSERLRRVRGCFCGIFVRIGFSQRVAARTDERDGSFASCAETARVLPRTNRSAFGASRAIVGDVALRRSNPLANRSKQPTSQRGF